MRKVMVWLMVVCMMGSVFYFSNEPASSSREVSIDITDKMLTYVSHFSPYVQLDEDHVHHLIRKSAHFILYMALGGLVFTACIQNRQSSAYNIGLTMSICILFAISDEVHQLFIPGRSGELRDVVIDGIGALGGIGIVLLVMRIGRWMKDVLEEYWV